MASCLLGSTAFGTIQARGMKVESAFAVMLSLATISMSIATYIGASNLAVLIAAFFLFEVCVGMYFPSIGIFAPTKVLIFIKYNIFLGTLRSKYLPDGQRSIIMNLFGIPLNLIVVSVFLSIRSLGVSGALVCHNYHIFNKFNNCYLI
jgi:hypothetical protein